MRSFSFPKSQLQMKSPGSNLSPCIRTKRLGSMPVHKEPSDQVFAGTINKEGYLEIGVTKLAKDSTIARLIQMVEEAQSEKAETQRFIDKYEQYYAVAVILLTGLAIVIPPLLLGEAPDESFYRAMTILVAASPCAIVISTPSSLVVASK